VTRVLRGVVALAVGIGVLAAVAPAGGGTFPGTNGLIAYTSGSNIDVITPDGTVITTIASGQYPSWNADGSKIAYSRSGDLYVANADGSNEVQLTSGAATDREPSWSPDGAQIVFMREESGPPTDRDVAVVDVATHTVTEIITGSFQAYYPAWSPDGTTIAYRSNQGGCASSFCIYLANPDGSGQTELVDSATFLASSQPSWSPDSAQVVFVYDDNPDATIYDGGIAVVSAGGGTPTALTDDAALNESNPAFSPDGVYIAFVRNGVLWRMEADGGDPAIFPATVVSTDLGVSWAVLANPAPPEPPGPPVTPPVPVTPTFTG
jgi:Tol biopolymer transport system component